MISMLRQTILSNDWQRLIGGKSSVQITLKPPSNQISKSNKNTEHKFSFYAINKKLMPSININFLPKK